jgi:uroporphyrinogen decarboxylase
VKPRERVLTALDHRVPDRVPIEFGSPDISGVALGEPFGYRALCEFLGLDDYPDPIMNMDSRVVLNNDERIMRRFGADLRWVLPGGAFEAEPMSDGNLRDPVWGFVMTTSGAFTGYQDENAPLRHARSARDIETFPYWPDGSDSSVWAGKREEARAFQEAGYATVASPGRAAAIFHNYSFLRGFDQWLMDMLDNPRLYHALAERILEADIAYMRGFLTEVADCVDIVHLADDMAMQSATFTSLEHYRAFCKPYQARWIAAARELVPNARILYHTCGAVAPLVADFIDIGVDVLNPVQPRARGMDARWLKREFGAALSFMGGFDTQHVLPFGTPTEIGEYARELIDALAPGGGFVFAPSHMIQPEVPPANIAAMYAAAQEYGRYPLKDAARTGDSSVD